MRKVILDTIISLDGYYTSLKNEIDWFEFEKEEIDWSKEILRRVGTMLYGRVLGYPCRQKYFSVEIVQVTPYFGTRTVN